MCIQSDRRDKHIPGLARVPYDLRFPLVFLFFHRPFRGLVSYKPILMAVVWLYISQVHIIFGKHGSGRCVVTRVVRTRGVQSKDAVLFFMRFKENTH